ncbi:hypothetical protein GCM10023321_78940 [Pseudonocardia eucalypti]|uniref:PASTA domain-containing protein n=2 Tax=Pseudonocardia eucalypti TaxID=648755 RepID=A0ABP9RBM5_9PSEU
MTVVPALVGLPATAAHDKALDAHLLAVDQDPSHKASVVGTVTAQDPAAGSYLEPGHKVLIWVSTGPSDDGGGGGNQPLPTGPAPKAPAGAK